MASKLSVAIASYLRDSEHKGNSPKTLREKKQFLNQFEKYCGKNPYSLEVIQDFIQAMRDRNLKNSVVALTVRRMRHFTKHYIAQYGGEDFGLKLIAPTLNRKLFRLHSVEITERIIRAGTEPGTGDNSRNRRIKLEEYRPALLFMLRTGLRSIEIQRMHGEDIEAYADNPSFYVHSKGGDTHRLPIPPNTLDMLRARVDKKRVFEVTNSQMNIVLARGCKKLGKHKITCHDLRHTFATDMLRNGSPMAIVSRWLRHKNVLITDQIYAHYQIEDLAESLMLHHTSQRASMSDDDKATLIRKALIQVGINQNAIAFNITNKSFSGSWK